MIAVNYSTLRENLKTYCDKVTDAGETVVVTRKDEKNVVIISLEEWNTLQKMAKKVEYFQLIDPSDTGIDPDRVLSKIMDELKSI
ncbi:MAG: type II toxin-antitoxin system Phd/YefM family antitoxin [Clostridia bacterium]|nr:type II toxin-antitoxin system Phd/YefM family antitoxin [Clostridia bacterium]